LTLLFGLKYFPALVLLLIVFHNINFLIYDEWRMKIASGTYPLYVSGKGIGILKVTDSFNVRNPIIGSITPNKGVGNTIVRLSGLYLGTKKPTVFLYYVDQTSKRNKKRRCKVTLYNMDQYTGVSQLNIIVARNFKGNSDALIELKNRIGITVIGFNTTDPDWPVVYNDFAHTPVNTAVTVNVLANDIGTDISVYGISSPKHGIAQINTDNDMVTYTPNPDFIGTDSFNYTVINDALKVAEGVVTISVGANLVADTNLANVIRTKLDLPAGTDITQTDLLQLTELDGSDKNIQGLTGLEYCTNLRVLFLTSNQITELTQLAGLVNLEKLYLGSNNIVTVKALRQLNNLKILDLSNNQLADLTGLPGNWPEALDLSGNRIADLTGLPDQNYQNLKTLNLSSNRVINIDLLSALGVAINLGVLNLSSNQISSIVPLSGLLSLEELYLNSNKLDNIDALANLGLLKVLALANNSISNLLPISNPETNSGLTDLIALELSGNELTDTDISVLTPVILAKLKTLYLDDNILVNIEAMKLFVQLTSLELQNNPLSTSAINEIIASLQAYGVKVEY